ncbi:hypothetical protein SBADM41S_12325 [Streptomyces badius]
MERNRPDWFGYAADLLELYLGARLRLPAIEPVGPTPGAAADHLHRPPAADEPRMLTRIRALLAKAEATGFPEEAEALTTKAQELMARHTIDAALAARTGSRETPGACGIGRKPPYESARPAGRRRLREPLPGRVERGLRLLHGRRLRRMLAEMHRAGLPWRADVHRELLNGLLGERYAGGGEPRRLAELADRVSAAFGQMVCPDLPAYVAKAFAQAGMPVKSTRRWELAELDHPAGVEPLIAYKKLYRIWTAHGWSWLQDWVREGRFRPEYQPAARSAAAGRPTAAGRSRSPR